MHNIMKQLMQILAPLTRILEKQEFTHCVFVNISDDIQYFQKRIFGIGWNFN